MSLWHRREYAADLPHGLPSGSCIPPQEFSRSPEGMTRIRATSGPDPPDSNWCRFKRRNTPVPRVLLSITLAGPAPSGSTGTSRLCQGRSRPPRHHPDQAALSFNNPAATERWCRSFTSTRTNSASRRKQDPRQSRSTRSSTALPPCRSAHLAGRRQRVARPRRPGPATCIALV